MPGNQADHPFEVGGTYANRRGIYEVLAIEPPNMRIRYEEDGREQVVNIVLKADDLGAPTDRFFLFRLAQKERT